MGESALDPGVIASLARGDLIGAAQSGFRQLRGGAALTPEATREQLAKMLLSQGEEGVKTLRLLESATPKDRQLLMRTLLAGGMAAQ